MSVRIRFCLSAILTVLYIGGMAVYTVVQGPMEAKIAVSQLQDSAVQYGVARAGAMGAIPSIAFWALVIFLALIWLPAAYRLFRGTAPLLLLVSAAFLAGCGDYQQEIVEEIGPNETAFLVPLEGETKGGQGKFMSIDYLNTAKVATKRVTIPTRRKDTGRAYYNYVWIPTVKMIKVDRKPVTRVWTKGKESGTSVSNQAICVESRESVDFCVGAIAIGSITEEDAAKFLYNYAGKPLSQVMDEDVRGFLGSVLSREFGGRTLDVGRNEKNNIFAIALKETREFFASRGLSISQIGGTEGLQYTDPKIQTAINDTFVAENDKIKAGFEKAAQTLRNQLNVERATAERQSAEEFAKAQDAQIAKIRLEIEKMRAEALLEAAKKWTGNMPANIMPQGSQLLFGLDRPAGK